MQAASPAIAIAATLAPQRSRSGRTVSPTPWRRSLRVVASTHGPSSSQSRLGSENTEPKRPSASSIAGRRRPTRALTCLERSFSHATTRSELVDDNRAKTRLAHLQNSQHIVEQLWSRAVATQRNPRQMLSALNRRNPPETVALGCAPSPKNFDGREGVDGSSPSEGLGKFPAKPAGSTQSPGHRTGAQTLAGK